MPDWTIRRAGPDDEGRRLDRIVRIAFPSLPLSALHRAFRRGLIRIGGKRCAPDRRVHEGESIEFAPGLDVGAGPVRVSGIAAVAAGNNGYSLPGGMLVLATRDLLFLNKPAGLLVHDGEDSLEAMVRRSEYSAGADSLSFRPGPLHRLDRNTSGLITFPRTHRGAEAFSGALREGAVSKLYIAILDGILSGPETWRDTLSRDGSTRKSTAAGPGETGKEAVTSAMPLASAGAATLACLSIATGLTHQIRAQAAIHGHPLAGDAKYGGGKTSKSYFLHAYSIRLRSTLFDDIPAAVRAEPPAAFLREIFSRFGIEAAELPALTDRLSF